MAPIATIHDLTTAASLRAPRLGIDTQPRWNLLGLAGRLVELTADERSASLTLAFGIVLEAQQQGEPVAWITTTRSTFFPPDAAGSGVDLGALPVVRAADVREFARAADHLARSGAFGLVVLDFGAPLDLSIPMQTRLLGLARRHDAALIFLTQKRPQSLGSLISLRGQTTKRKTGDDAFTCALTAVKDKRRTPGWNHEEVCRGPAGLH